MDSVKSKTTLMCPECEKELILRWSKTDQPVIKHKVKSRVEHKLPEETLIHLFARKSLCEFLNDGGKCSFTHKCVRTQESVASRLIYEEDISINSKYSKLDIAGTNIEGRVVFCIEIRNKDKIIDPDERKTLTWFEVDAIDVLRWLRRVVSGSIVLENLRQMQCCIRYAFTPEIRHDFAIKLGCFRRTDTHRAYVIHQLVIKSDCKCNLYFEEWMLPNAYVPTPGSTPPTEIWNEFIKYQQCLYCEVAYKSSMLKPYCPKCLEYVEDGCIYMDICEITKDTQSILRSYLSWLCKIPNASKPGLACHFCKKTERTMGHPQSIWWFGDMKNLCWECFDQKLEKDGVYNIKLKTITEVE